MTMTPEPNPHEKQPHRRSNNASDISPNHFRAAERTGDERPYFRKEL
jgi:hypothetical protein